MTMAWLIVGFALALFVSKGRGALRLEFQYQTVCPPENADNLQRVRTIVSYIDARPERNGEDFRLPANEAHGESLAMQAIAQHALPIALLWQLTHKSRSKNLQLLRVLYAYTIRGGVSSCDQGWAAQRQWRAASGWRPFKLLQTDQTSQNLCNASIRCRF